MCTTALISRHSGLKQDRSRGNHFIQLYRGIRKTGQSKSEHAKKTTLVNKPPCPIAEGADGAAGHYLGIISPYPIAGGADGAATYEHSE